MEVIRRHPTRFRAAVLTANRRWEALDALALEEDPDFVVLGAPPAEDFAPRWGGEWRFGTAALAEAAGSPGVDIVLNAVVGFAGLGATLANKALEVIEAHTLFDLAYERIEVVVHPTSIVHSVVEFRDGSSLAQLGRPSMETPILWALGYPDRLENARPEAGFDPVRDGPLEFEPVREEDFPLFRAGVAAGEAGGEFPVAFNAANEVAVERFLSGGVDFPELHDVVLRTLERFSSRAIESVEDARCVDARARAIARDPSRESKSGDAE